MRLMRCVLVLLSLCLVPGSAPAEEAERSSAAIPLPTCARESRTVDILNADPTADAGFHRQMVRRFITEAGVENTTIRLGPNVVLDFSEFDLESAHPLVPLARCVTIRSMTPAELAAIGLDPRLARGPSALGPTLRFGPLYRNGIRRNTKSLLGVRCFEGARSGARISGFRLFGATFGQQRSSEYGVRIQNCRDVEISNMEIAGWGGAAVAVENDDKVITDPSQVRIHGNYIHHNQFPTSSIIGGSAKGYGVVTNDHAWADVRRNVFDDNRHAIAATGLTGGYDAVENLVLKGGGVHSWYKEHTHQFDVHGTGCSWSSDLCGDAGQAFLYQSNAFQYRNAAAISIRGEPQSPTERTLITLNVFPHPGLEDDWGDDAIVLQTTDNITIGRGNRIDIDTYGQYGVCDFDGDKVDDLFLATGASWWFSSFGEFQWSFLSVARQTLDQVRLGYFDEDLRCDVLIEDSGEWFISSGATAPFRSIGSFGAPLREVVFGRFDPRVRDHRPEATKRTTHAFRRPSNSVQWYVTALDRPQWTPVQSSSQPLGKLRFGDFTGDGVTDVLAVVGGRWSISESARGTWRELNPTLGDDLAGVMFADLAHDNVDDVIRLEQKTSSLAVTLIWWVSNDGRRPWRKLKEYTFSRAEVRKLPRIFAGAGRFGAAPGGAVLLTDPDRKGRFYGESEVRAGASPNWSSQFPY
jgi:hypothetical protein